MKPPAWPLALKFRFNLGSVDQRHQNCDTFVERSSTVFRKCWKTLRCRIHHDEAVGARRGASTGGAKRPRSMAASAARAAPAKPAGKKPLLSPGAHPLERTQAQALVIPANLQLPAGKSPLAAGLATPAEQYGIIEELPAKRTKALTTTKKLPLAPAPGRLGFNRALDSRLRPPEVLRVQRQQVR